MWCGVLENGKRLFDLKDARMDLNWYMINPSWHLDRLRTGALAH